MKDTVDPDTGEVLPDDIATDDASDFDPELGTLMGDMRDAMLSRIRTLQKPWAQMTEAEQIDCANGVELAARDMIRKTVRLVNKHEWPTCVVTLEELKIGGKAGIDIKVTCPNISDYRNVLGDHVKTSVMMVFADSETFMAAKAPVEIDRDQPEMDLQDGDGVPDPAGAEEDRRPAEGDLE